MCEETPELQRYLVTIDITADGRITCWTASEPDGQVVEDWRLVGQFTSAAHSHTWEADGPAYLVIRDILRFLTEDDWQPNTVM